MTSHELATKLQETATYLLAHENVDVSNPMLRVHWWSDKEPFLRAVRAFVPGKKVIDNYNVTFEPKGTMLALVVSRDLVCRKVQDVKYECEPLLSPEEDAEMERTNGQD